MRPLVAIGGIMHETNTYCRPTPLGAFHVTTGDEVLKNPAGYGPYAQGMIDAARDLGIDLLPTLTAVTPPSGTIEWAAYESLLEGVLAPLRKTHVDGIALTLHGAGVVEGIDDLEGHLCRAVREIVGPGVPITVSLDLHGNLATNLADVVDGMFGVHHYPHIDMYERGYEAMALIPRILSGEVRPVVHIEPIPMLLAPFSTFLPPMSEVVERCLAAEQRDGIIDCALFHGFPYADLPFTGCSVAVTADGDRGLARSCAEEMAGWIWDRRNELKQETHSPADAIALALEIDGRPVVINETYDNPGGGAPGDSTHLLRAMLDAGISNACLGFVFDPEVVAAACRAGVGRTIDITLGGKHDDLHGKPVPMTAYVKGITDGKFAMPAWRWLEEDLGVMTRLQCQGIDILVSSIGGSQTLDPEVFLLNGIDISRYKIVGVKSNQHFRAGFGSVAAAIVTADGPGLTTLDISTFPRVRTPRPIWPLDTEAHYQRSENVGV